MFEKFYTKTREQRIKILLDNENISSNSYKYLIDSIVMDNDLASNLIENQLTIYGMPYGLATNFLINGKKYVIPMVTEEPSVIAAASNAGKIISENGGFNAQMDARIMIGQIAFYDIKVDEPIKIIEEKRIKFLN